MCIVCSHVGRHLCKHLSRCVCTSMCTDSAQICVAICVSGQYACADVVRRDLLADKPLRPRERWRRAQSRCQHYAIHRSEIRRIIHYMLLLCIALYIVHTSETRWILYHICYIYYHIFSYTRDPLDYISYLLYILSYIIHRSGTRWIIYHICCIYYQHILFIDPRPAGFDHTLVSAS